MVRDVPPRTIHRRAPRAHDRAPELTVLFDGDCGFCSWCANVLDRLDHRRTLRLVPLQGAVGDFEEMPSRHDLLEALHVRDRAGRWERGGTACLRIAGAVPLLSPLAVAGRLPLVQRWVEALYRLVAHNRHRLGRLLGLDGCTYQPR